MPTADREQIDSQLLDLVQDFGQRALEVICSEDVLKEIPLIKTALVARAAIRSIKDEILLKKLEACLTALSDVSQEQRLLMVEALESDPKYGRRVGEHLIELLDRVDSHRKPSMLGEVFPAYMRGKIDPTMLQRLLGVIERLPTIEIDTVRKFVNSSNSQPDRDRIDRESIQALTNAGLTWTTTGPIGGQIGYNANRTCSMFVELNLDVKSTTRT